MNSVHLKDAIPAISVMMPVYNAERFVEEAVRSILRQTYGDFELLIVDDGSTDSSGAILERLAAEDQRIRLTRRENRGLVATLNQMLELARAPLLARMDADDLCVPYRFERQYAFLTAHPEVVAVGTAFEHIDEESRFLWVPPALIGSDAIHEMALSGRTPVCHATVMMRAEACRRAGGYDETTMLAEDLDLFLRLAEIGKLENINESMYSYRIHGESVSTQRHERQLEIMRAVSRRACERLGRNVEFMAVPWRPTDRLTQHHYTVLHGRLAYNHRQYRTALIYAMRAIRMRPTHAGGWNLLKWATIDWVRTTLRMLPPVSERRRP